MIKNNTNSDKPYRLITFSAKTVAALKTATDNLIDCLADNPNVNLADVGYTLQTDRAEFSHRRIVVVPNNIKDSIETLKEIKNLLTCQLTRSNRAIVFMFPGQGGQYLNMGKELYENEPVFQKEINFCFNLVRQKYKINLEKIIYPKTDDNEAAKVKIDQIEYSQLILFIFEYALAGLINNLGIKPDYFIGHSLGEYTAACLSGVFSLSDTLDIIMKKALLVGSLPQGAMLAISINEQELIGIINQINQKIEESIVYNKLNLAAVNSPALCVVSGKTNSIELLEYKLTSLGCQHKRLKVDYALHSNQLDSLLKSLKTIIRSTGYRIRSVKEDLGIGSKIFKTGVYQEIDTGGHRLIFGLTIKPKIWFLSVP